MYFVDFYFVFNLSKGWKNKSLVLEITLTGTSSDDSVSKEHDLIITGNKSRRQMKRKQILKKIEN